MNNLLIFHNFTNRTHVCNQQPDQETEHYQHPRSLYFLLSSHYFSMFWLLTEFADFAAWGLYICEGTQLKLLCLASLAPHRPVRVILTIACSYRLFILIAPQCSTLNIEQFIHSDSVSYCCITNHPKI